MGPGVSVEAGAVCEGVNGVRVRRPWIDIDLWEFFLGLRAEQKFPEPRDKGLVRRILRGRIPDEVLDRTDKTLFTEAHLARVDYALLRRLLLGSEIRLEGIDYACSKICSDRNDWTCSTTTGPATLQPHTRFSPNGERGSCRTPDRPGEFALGGAAAAPDRGALLAVDDVSHRFGEFQVLRDVSLHVAPGAVHAILGPNGAGKTTLVRIVAGLLTPAEGTVRVGDVQFDASPRCFRQLVGYIPSGDRSFYLRISAFENLVFFGRLHGLGRKEAARRARELIEAVGLTEADTTPRGQLLARHAEATRDRASADDGAARAARRRSDARSRPGGRAHGARPDSRADAGGRLSSFG